MTTTDDEVIRDIDNLEENISAIIDEFERKNTFSVSHVVVYRKFDGKADVSVTFMNGF